ncbi:MAG: DUF502 domain-containing protein [bacterium]
MSKWQKVKGFLKINFFSGLLVVIPLLVSLYVLIKLLQLIYAELDFLFERLSKYLPEWIASTIDDRVLRIGEFAVVMAVLLFLIALVGMITKLRLFNWIIGVGERLVGQIPLMGMVYSAVKQLLQAIFSGKGNFSRVVIIEYPRRESWSLGFVSRKADVIFSEKSGQSLTSVFVPTTPNPTSGFLLMLPEKDIIDVNITVEQAFKIIISAGMVLAHEEPEDGLYSGSDFINEIKKRMPGQKEGDEEE